MFAFGCILVAVLNKIIFTQIMIDWLKLTTQMILEILSTSTKELGSLTPERLNYMLMH